MKKLFCNAVLIILAMTVISCTEEIAEEVQNKSELNEDGSISDYSTRSLRLVSKMDENLSFVMHKAGNADADCELQAPTAGFDADDYNYKSSTYTVDCVLEVEELDLMEHGVSFEVQIDDNLCEYVGYAPYSFLRYKPGNTTRNIYKVECDSNCSDPTATNSVSSICDKTYDDYDPTQALGSEVSNVVNEDEEPLCFYDWSQQYASESDSRSYPNCDEGTVRVYTIKYKGIDDSDGNGTTGDLECISDTIDMDYAETDCGGKHNNCLDGAITESGLDYANGYTLEVYDNKEMESFTKSWTYSGNFADVDDGHATWLLANYSRYCADDSLKASDAATDQAVLTGYDLEDLRYATGSTTATAILADASDTFYTVGGGTYKDVEATDYAENLFRGVPTTIPYYAIACFDKAYDIKAQMRLFIREWDKEFSKTSVFLNRNSDSDETTPNMDLNDTLQSNTGSLNLRWNDYDDLDDFFRDHDGSDNNLWTSGQCRSTANTNNALTPSLNDSINNFPGNSARYR